MFKKVLLSSLIGATLQTNATNLEKELIASGNTSIQNIKQANANQLILSAGIFDPLTEKLDFSKSLISNDQPSSYTIIQFYDGFADSKWLEENGIKVVSYLPNNAFIVSTNKPLVKTLTLNNNIRWFGKYLSSYKFSPDLLSKNNRYERTFDISIALFSDIKEKNINNIFRKYLPKSSIKEILKGNNNQVIITLARTELIETLNTLSKIDAVQYVEIVKPLKYLNTEAVSAVQANVDADSISSNDDYTPSVTPIWDRGLIGSGQIIGVADSGLDSNEDWFVHYDNGTEITHAMTEAEDTIPPTIGTLYPNRKVIGHFVMPGALPYEEESPSFHGTHVTGSVAGDRLEFIAGGPPGNVSSPNNPGYDNDDGMAPNAQILFQDIGGVGEVDGEIEAVLSGQGSSPMWEQAYNAGVRIHSNSYGSDGDGAYSFSDIRADETLHKFEDMLIVFAAGNDGPDDNTIGSPGNAKNVLTVGMLNHGNSIAKHALSSRGPTDDGRIKPDIAATGAQIESAMGDTNTTTQREPPLRATSTGTSMATPITSGSTALVRQYFTDGYYPTGSPNDADKHNPTGALLKALMINGAGTDAGHFDMGVGWGRVNVSNSIFFDDSDKNLRVWEVTNPNGLKAGESIEFKLEVKSGQKLAVTLVWYDLPGPFGSSKTLINDLDLTVKINGDSYKGNVFTTNATSKVGGTYDSLNSVEQVRIPTPVEGTYTITVKGADIPGNGTLNSIRQGFALVATGDLDNISSMPPAITNVTNLTAASQGNDGIQLNWEGGENADYFEVYRVLGTCSSANYKQLRFIGSSESGSFTDFRTLLGNNYAYKIRAGQYGGLGPLAETCTDIVSTQACDFLPSFEERSIKVTDNVGDSCHNSLEWSAATSNCSTTSAINYNIYRSEDSSFIPDSSNLLTQVSGTSFDDISAPNVPVYYIIRAEDDTGTETTGTSRLRSLAIGTGSTFSPIIEDVDNVSIATLNFPWQVVSNKAADGSILSYKTGEATGNYSPNSCGSLVTNTISLTDGESNPKIEYKANYSLEQNWDGVVVEISTDDGATWIDLPPNGGYPGNFSETVIGDNGQFINGCQYPTSQGAFSGNNNNTFETFSHDLSQFVGEDVKIRWQISTDGAAEEEGFYIDSIQYPNVATPSACTVNPSGLNKIESGLYYDKSRDGHGFAIEQFSDDLYFTAFYTYQADGTPEWYTSLSKLVDNVLIVDLEDLSRFGELNRFNYNYNIDPTGAGNPNSIDPNIANDTRTLEIDFNSTEISQSSACNDGVNRGENIALASWQLGSQLGQWCIEPLSNNIGQPPALDFGGTWWTGIDDDGWGLSISFTGDTIVLTSYYFDADGNPRWALGTQSGFEPSKEISVNMLEFNGFARDEIPTNLTNESAGTVSITINNSGIDGDLNMSLTYKGNEGGTWSRSNVPLSLFTSPH